jgi:biotin carboxyl carrier protein
VIYHVTINGTSRVVSIEAHGVSLDGIPVDVDFARIAGNGVSGRGVVHIDDAAHAVVYGHRARLGSDPDATQGWLLSLGSEAVEAVVLDDRQRTIREMVTATAAARGPQPIKAPMPGMVVKVEVDVGDRVELGQGIVVVEAMKMENELQAQAIGVVRRVHVEPGQAVEKDQVLVEFGSLEDETP